MMVVLLIISVVAAASAPMINKKMITAASDKSPWVWVGNSGAIAYNLDGGNIPAIVGTQSQPNMGGRTPRLYLEGQQNNPALAIGEGDAETVLTFRTGRQSLLFSNEDPEVIPDDSIGIGFGVTSAQEAIAIGSGAEVNAPENGPSRAIAIGGNSGITEAVENAIAIGHSAKAGGASAVVMGPASEATATAPQSIVIGYSNTIGADNAIAIGREIQTAGARSIAIGSPTTSASSTSSTQATGNESIAIGTGSAATSQAAIAIGNTNVNQTSTTSGVAQTTASGEKSIAIGPLANASRLSSIAIGDEAAALVGASNDGSGYEGASGDSGRSIAIGAKAKAHNKQAISIGTETESTGDYSIALGSHAKALAQDAIAIGSAGGAAVSDIDQLTRARAQRSIAIGWNAKVDDTKHTNSVAIGTLAKTTAANQIVLGNSNSTVYIPGKLVVAGSVMLGLDGASRVYVNLSDGHESSAGMSRLESDGCVTRSSWKSDGVSVTYDEAITQLSDRRLKNVGKAFVGGLEEIKKLELFNYSYKKDPNKTPRVGVMAQDLQKIFPNAVTKGDDGFLRIRMEDMFYALVNAVKELAGKFDIHEKKIVELEKQNKELNKTIAELEKRLEKLEKKAK